MATAPTQTLLDDQLERWMSILVTAIKSDRPDLTNRQMALLLTVYLRPLPHTVRGLSARLYLSKPVISRAVQLLEVLGLLRRQKDDVDRRNIFVERTSAGAAFLLDFFGQAQPSSALAELQHATPGRLPPQWQHLRDRHQPSRYNPKEGSA